ncbi:MAG: hypothetical protein HC809_12645, partial [Gammaproteobacteria bacterium]|nr:hypothetical protein [Gammaproteobacteria bacterium]
MKRWFLYGVVAAGVWWWSQSDATSATRSADGNLTYPGYTIEPLEAFEIEARVLSREDYSFDREAQLAATDLALGWGPMADDAVLDEIEVWQRNRWYYWQASHLPIAKREIVQHSANMHLIAASPQVAAAIKRVDKNDRVRLAGKLVEVRGEDGWRWRARCRAPMPEQA